MTTPTLQTLYRLEDMFPDELDEHISCKPMLVLPFGTIEWHSYHLPVGLDSLKAQAICERVAQKTGAVLAPLISTAVGAVPFPYGLAFDLPIIERLMCDVFTQYVAMGFRVIVAITGHYGLDQTLAIKRAALACMRQTGATVLAAGDFEVATDIGYLGDHAAKWETSLLWAIRPDLVRLGSAARDVALDGIIGEDPRIDASQALGASTLAHICDRFAEMADRLLSQTNGVQRMRYIEALNAAVRVIEWIAGERKVKPKSQVPPLVTPHYVAYLEAIRMGDYAAAQKHAEAKLADPAH